VQRKNKTYEKYSQIIMNTYDLFVEVVKLKSFSEAAKKFHRSPSAISKQISQLEQKLNTQLIDRTTRSLSITEAGRLYYEKCLDISARMQDAEAELKELAEEPQGIINITWPTAISYSKVVDALSAFIDQYPKIRIKLNANIDVLNLTDENIDIAFRSGPLIDSPMVAITLFKMQPIFCSSPEAIAKFGFPETIQELTQAPMVILNNFNILQKARAALPDFKNLNIEDHHSTNDLQANLNMVKKGMGSTFLFKHMVEKELTEGTLVQVIPGLKFPPVPVHLMYQKLNYMPKKIRCFIDFFKAELQDE
jgi:DNA-binding transcriptional LysR family regulator